MKARKGAVSDINLLLVAMLRYAGIKADPVILSTTQHGYAPEAFPMTNNYNYVIVQCKADGKNFYLDATQPLLGFGRLLPFCFNGHARVINDFGDPIYLRADSLLESKTSFLMVSNTDKGQWQGSMNQVPGYFESYSIRSKVKESGKEAFFKKKEKEMGIDVKINDMQIDSLSKLELPVKIQYSFDVNTENADILYINPMFGHGYDKNPFSSANRYYPVEMPYTKDETFILNMEVPKGYVVDELPKQMLAKFDEEGKTFFEYRIALSGDNISFRTRIKVDRTFFMPDEYEILREFYNMIVKKQAEQIVFKKKK
jgi:acyl carrier protein